jgi:hypothetical protein
LGNDLIISVALALGQIVGIPPPGAARSWHRLPTKNAAALTGANERARAALVSGIVFAVCSKRTSYPQILPTRQKKKRIGEAGQFKDI